MDLSNLKPAKGSVKRDKRLGRGEGSGRGGTATKGHKGQKSRSGYKRKIGFEGGQMPLQRRVPKFGFRNINRKSYKGVNLGILQELAEKGGVTTVDVQTLVNAGYASGNDLIKILGGGKLEVKLEVQAHAFSESAREAIEKSGGTAVKI